MVYTSGVSSEEAVYGLHCVIRRHSLIMVYTVCHQEQSMVYTVSSNYV